MNFPGSCKGRVPLLKNSQAQTIALGHKAMTKDWVLMPRGQGLDGLRWLIRNFQIPTVGRESAEDYAPFGIHILQQGKVLHDAGEIPITFVSDVDGRLFGKIRELADKKCYWDATLRLDCEEKDAPSAHKWEFTNCFLKLDPVDLATDDTTSLIKPAGTFYYNWVD